MTLAIKAIIFDLEGVLMKTKDADLYLSVANALETPYGSVREIYFSEMNDQVDLGLFTQEQFEENVINMLGLEPKKIKILQQVHEEQTFIDSLMLEKIKSLKKKYKIGLLSNYSTSMRNKIEKEWRIGDAFDAIIISSEVGVIKPDPAIFELMMERLGSQAHESVLIDDRIKNIQGAENIGMRTIHYHDRAQTVKDLDFLLNSH